MKDCKWIFKVAAVFVAVAALVALIIIFKEQLSAFFGKMKDKLCCEDCILPEEARAVEEDFSDFADI